MTRSLCPTCFKEIDAEIIVADKVYMAKICPEHGSFVGIVEKDPQWFKYCQDLGCNNIYNGYMIDVTGKCNLKCKYCYHDNTGGHRPTKEILRDAMGCLNLAPFILSGGEPTLHPDLPHIIDRLTDCAETWILSNGIELCDKHYFNELCKAGLIQIPGIVNVGLSIHKESNGKDMEFLELCRHNQLKAGSVFYVIDSVDQISDAIALFKEYRTSIYSMRIKAASNLWNESGALNKIFVSDMLAYFCSMGPTQIMNGAPFFNKVSYANIMHDGLLFHLISWYDATNVDLMDIDCPPYHKGKDGKIRNLAASFIMNGKPQ